MVLLLAAAASNFVLPVFVMSRLELRAGGRNTIAGLEKPSPSMAAAGVDEAAEAPKCYTCKLCTEELPEQMFYKSSSRNRCIDCCKAVVKATRLAAKQNKKPSLLWFLAWGDPRTRAQMMEDMSSFKPGKRRRNEETTPEFDFSRYFSY